MINPQKSKMLLPHLFTGTTLLVFDKKIKNLRNRFRSPFFAENVFSFYHL